MAGGEGVSVGCGLCSLGVVTWKAWAGDPLKRWRRSSLPTTQTFSSAPSRHVLQHLGAAEEDAPAPLLHFLHAVLNDPHTSCF